MCCGPRAENANLYNVTFLRLYTHLKYITGLYVYGNEEAGELDKGAADIGLLS